MADSDEAGLRDALTTAGPVTPVLEPKGTAVEAKVERPRAFRCPGCNGNLLFAPVDGCLACPYCGRVEKIPESKQEIRENSYDDFLKIHPDRLFEPSSQFIEHQCPSCNAVLEIPSEQATGDCPFCDTKMVILEKSGDPLVAPEATLPMLVNGEQAQKEVRVWLQSRWFAPNSLKRFAEQDVMQGIYLPYWTFDSNATTHFTGERGEYYYTTEEVTEYIDGKQQRVSRQVRHVQWYPTSGMLERWFDDVVIPASKSLKESHLNGLEPWDLTKLKPFDPAFLSGFKAERYRIDLPTGFENAKGVMTRAIYRDVQIAIGGDEQRVGEVESAYSAITFKHVLLPVWAGAYRLQGKTFQVVVNGRNGAVQGDRPFSVWKILIAVIAAIIILGIGLQLNSKAGHPVRGSDLRIPSHLLQNPG